MSSSPEMLTKHPDDWRQRAVLLSEEVCAILKVSRTQLYHLRRAKEIRACKVGRLVRFRPEQIVEYLDKLDQESRAESGYESGYKPRRPTAK